MKVAVEAPAANRRHFMVLTMVEGKNICVIGSKQDGNGIWKMPVKALSLL